MPERISIEEAIQEAGLKKKFVANELGISETYLPEYLKNLVLYQLKMQPSSVD